MRRFSLPNQSLRQNYLGEMIPEEEQWRWGRVRQKKVGGLWPDAAGPNPNVPSVIIWNVCKIDPLKHRKLMFTPF